MNRTQQIIYDLLYSEEDIMKFDITGMTDNIEDCPDLVESIINKVNKGKVEVVKDTIIVDNNQTVHWKLKVKRK
tara:strand:+ start:55625 stop:55846 length:222 start_codon:yes stop_codon:yes gene_type:complete